MKPSTPHPAPMLKTVCNFLEGSKEVMKYYLTETGKITCIAVLCFKFFI